jgi:hypothetical protein
MSLERARRLRLDRLATGSTLTNGLEDGRRKPLPGRTLTVVPRPDHEGDGA